MNLDPNRRLVRFAYLFESDKPGERYYSPKQTTLCAFFWRLVGKSVFFILLSILVGLLLSLAVQNPLRSVSVVGGIVLYVAAMVGLEEGKHWLQERRWKKEREGRDQERGLTEPTALSVVWEGVKSVKRKFCPIIHFTTEE